MSNNITNSNSFNAHDAFEKTQSLDKIKGADQAKTPSAKPNETGLVDNSSTKPDTFIPFVPIKPDERGFTTLPPHSFM